MPVNTPHSQYAQRIEEWTDCRDAAEGSRAIKARGEKHLPRLGGQDDNEYKAYKMRALWYGATGRTVHGLLGSVFRRAVQIEAPDAMTQHLEDVTLTGINLEAFCKSTLQEILKVGRYGVLVDMGKEEGKSDRPYWVGYTAERIVNWATQQVNGDTILTLVVLSEEHIEPAAGDQFETAQISQYRVLRLVNGQYSIEIWRQPAGKPGEWAKHETITPLNRGARIPYIPFVFIGSNALTPDTDRPPLLDLVDVNLSHYRSSADLEHGRHFCGLPTPWVAGFPIDTVLKIGSSIAWVSNDPNARVGMLEFTGQGLGALETALSSKEALMAILGARMLESQKKAVEAFDTHEIRNAGESSILQSITGTVEEGLTMAMGWHAAWLGITATARVTLNKVFVEARMGPAELSELMKSWQAGGISYETLYWNMERGELTRPDVPVTEEQRLISLQAPARLPLSDSDPETPLS